MALLSSICRHGLAFLVGVAVTCIVFWGSVLEPEAPPERVAAAVASTAPKPVDCVVTASPSPHPRPEAPRPVSVAGTVPVVTLDRILPGWASDIHFLKIDTQGNELKILKGASESLAKRRFRNILYEFSPTIMRNGGLGDPLELVKLLPGAGAMCFDMLQRGTNNKLPRPGEPFDAYLRHLDEGHGSHYGHDRVIIKSDGIGPWDDIMCAWPASSGAKEDIARDFAEQLAWDWSCPTLLRSFLNGTDPSFSRDVQRRDGLISSAMRDQRCGHENMEPPAVLRQRGDYRIVVDIGLGTDARETVDAMNNGFLVIAFEMLPANFAALKEKLGRIGNPGRIQFIELLPPAGGTGPWTLPFPLEQPGSEQSGNAYIIHAGVSDVETSVSMSGGMSLVAGLRR